MGCVFPFTGTKTKEGVVQSVTSGKSTERCGNLWCVAARVGCGSCQKEGLCGTPLISTSYHLMSGGCLPGATVQGLLWMGENI